MSTTMFACRNVNMMTPGGGKSKDKLIARPFTTPAYLTPGVKIKLVKLSDHCQRQSGRRRLVGGETQRSPKSNRNRRMGGKRASRGSLSMPDLLFSMKDGNNSSNSNSGSNTNIGTNYRNATFDLPRTSSTLISSSSGGKKVRNSKRASPRTSITKDLPVQKSSKVQGKKTSRRNNKQKMVLTPCLVTPSSPSSSKTAATRSSNLSVSFASKVRVQSYLSIVDYAKKEVKDCWFSPIEMKVIKASHKQLVGRLLGDIGPSSSRKNGKKNKSKKQSPKLHKYDLIGLDSLLPQGQIQKEINIMNGYIAVFEMQTKLQQQQMHSDTTAADAYAISKAYRRASAKECRKEAHVRGVRDFKM